MESRMSIIEKLGITPGPWDVTGAYNHVVCQKGNEDPRNIICESWERKQNENAKPENINLIAAAPEMLEALIEDLIEDERAYNRKGFTSPVDLLGRSEFLTEEYNSFQRKLYVIEKATGKSWEEIKALL